MKTADWGLKESPAFEGVTWPEFGQPKSPEE
jgi:hypothetical protein